MRIAEGNWGRKMYGEKENNKSHDFCFELKILSWPETSFKGTWRKFCQVTPTVYIFFHMNTPPVTGYQKLIIRRE